MNTSDVMQKVREDIQKVGWSVMCVGGNAFCYTIGLWQSYKHPELLVAGLPYETGHAILNTVGRGIRDDLRRCQVDSPDTTVLQRHPVIYKPMHSSRYDDYMRVAICLYEGHNFPVLQLVYPDQEGRFPWQERYWLPQTAQPSLWECRPTFPRDF